MHDSYFLLNNIENAIKTEKRIFKIAPQAIASLNFSLGFLYTFTGDYTKARFHYKLGFMKKTSFDWQLIQDCVFFIQQTIDEFPNLVQFKFVLGLLEIYRRGVQNGIRELKEFIELAKNDKTLVNWIEEANKEISKYEENKRDTEFFDSFTRSSN